MDDTKSVFQSKTIIGIMAMVIAALGPVIASKFGITVTTADGQAVLDTLSQLGTAAGGALAIYGRVKATKKIG